MTTTTNTLTSSSSPSSDDSFVSSATRRGVTSETPSPPSLLRNAKRSPPPVITNVNAHINCATLTTNSITNSITSNRHQPKKKMKNGHHPHHHHHPRRTNSMTDEEFEEFVEKDKSAKNVNKSSENEEDKDSVVETTTSEDEEEEDDFDGGKLSPTLVKNQSRQKDQISLCYNVHPCLDCKRFSDSVVLGEKEGKEGLRKGGEYLDEDNTSDLTSSPPPPLSSSSNYSSSSADSSPSSSSLNPLQTLKRTSESSKTSTTKSLETLLNASIFEQKLPSPQLPPPPPPLPLSEGVPESEVHEGEHFMKMNFDSEGCCPLCCPDPEVRLEKTSSCTKENSSHLLPYYPPTVSSIRDAVSHLTRLDDFNVVKLSHGFFSQVFKVVHFSTKKVMVLKMNKEAGNRGNALKEIELLNKLNHENIVAYMGTVVHEGALHPLLEFINGGTLEQLIRPFYAPEEGGEGVEPSLSSPPPSHNCGHHYASSSPPTEQGQHYHQQLSPSCPSSLIISPKVHRLRDPDWTFLKLMRDVAAGMEYLHACGYLHRDLASKNVFIRKRAPNVCDMRDGGASLGGVWSCVSETDYDWFDDHRLTAVIGDFGFATTEPTPDQKLSTVGSPYWLAPECFKNQWYNHRCDIYSFGVVCCELNWRVPADPDFLPRLENNFAVDFGKLDCRGRKGTALGKVAQLACSINPAARPEFSTILDMFDFELNKRLNGLKKEEEESLKNLSSNFDYHLDSKMINLDDDKLNSSQLTPSFKRGFSLDSSMLQSVQLQQVTPLKSHDESDIFEQHLLRRRYSTAKLTKASGTSSPDHRASISANCHHHHSPLHSHHHHHHNHNFVHRNFSSPLPDVRSSEGVGDTRKN